MHVENTEKALLDHVLEMNKLKKKIMIEFIVRKSAEKLSTIKRDRIRL